MQCEKDWNRNRMNHQRYQSLAEKPWSQVARTCDAAQTRENSGKSTVWWAQVGIGQKKLKKNKVLHNDFNLRKIIHQNHWFWWLSSKMIAASMGQATSITKTPGHPGQSVSANGRNQPRNNTKRSKRVLAQVDLSDPALVSKKLLDAAGPCNIM